MAGDGISINTIVAPLLDDELDDENQLATHSSSQNHTTLHSRTSSSSQNHTTTHSRIHSRAHSSSHNNSHNRDDRSFSISYVAEEAQTATSYVAFLVYDFFFGRVGFDEENDTTTSPLLRFLIDNPEFFFFGFATGCVPISSRDLENLGLKGTFWYKLWIKMIISLFYLGVLMLFITIFTSKQDSGVSFCRILALLVQSILVCIARYYTRYVMLGLLYTFFLHSLVLVTAFYYSMAIVQSFLKRA
jgi:hypothetical protein